MQSRLLRPGLNPRLWRLEQRPQTPRAYLHPLPHPVNGQRQLLNVRQETRLGMPLGVTNVVPGHPYFVAKLTFHGIHLN